MRSRPGLILVVGWGRISSRRSNECTEFRGDREPSKPTARRPGAGRPGPGRWTRNGLPRNSSPGTTGLLAQNRESFETGLLSPRTKNSSGPSWYGRIDAERAARGVRQRGRCNRRRGRSGGPRPSSSRPGPPARSARRRGRAPARVVVVDRVEERLAVERDRQPAVHDRRFEQDGDGPPRLRPGRERGGPDTREPQPVAPDLERPVRGVAVGERDDEPVGARVDPDQDGADARLDGQPRPRSSGRTRGSRRGGRRRCRG